MVLFGKNSGLHRTLIEQNQCAYYFTKLESSSDVDFLTHAYPPEDVHDLLRNDAIGLFFVLRE
jgi:hypothetical protein